MRTLTERRICLALDQACSMELRSGEMSRAPAASIRSRRIFQRPCVVASFTRWPSGARGWLRVICVRAPLWPRKISCSNIHLSQGFSPGLPTLLRFLAILLLRVERFF